MIETARILIVDDDEGIRNSLRIILEEEGYFVDAAETGKEAITKSYANFYNLALIDIQLPDMEGIKLLTSMKETTPKMVKIIITGHPGMQNAIKAVNKGADAYVVKPFKMEKVLEMIREHLKRQEVAKKYAKEKVAEFVETRIMELEEERFAAR